MKDVVTITRDQIEKHFTDEIHHLLDVVKDHVKKPMTEYSSMQFYLLMVVFSAHVTDRIFNEEDQDGEAVH